MKVTAAAVSLLAVGAGASSTKDPAAAFAAWQREYGETFAGGATEYKHRLAVFTENMKTVAALNQEGHATFALNRFAALSPEEFAAGYLSEAMGRAPAHAADKFLPPRAANATAASAFDWRESDPSPVTEVKDQGALGSCWAFSTAGNLEGQLVLSGGGALTSLSVEQILECDASFDDDLGHADCGEFGGWPYLALQYVAGAGGLRSDESMPYCAGVPYGKDGNCLPCMPSGYSTALCGSYDDDFMPLYCESDTTLGQGSAGWCSDTKVGPFAVSPNGWAAVSSDEGAIADELVATGPLSVALNAQRLQFYKSGVFAPSTCNPDELDHAVLLVGFGDDDADYWTVKNSWGDSWGEAGYFRILRGEGTCGINTAVVTGTL